MTQKARWVLPSVVDPSDTVCFEIRVPNDRQHIGAFYGAIFNLAKPYNWQNDGAHTAIAVGAVWGKIFDELIAGGCTIQKPGLRGNEVDDMSILRVDCDCRLWVTCCDGTEKEILTSAAVKALIAGSNVDGAPQPPTGGSVCYTFVMNANQQLLIPTPVSTGDVITITANGATNDPDHLAAIWRCPDGSQYFAGGCVGFPDIVGGSDPVPASPHMMLIIKIGSNYYPYTGPFTVPGGVSLVQPVLQVNDSAIGNDNGALTLEVCVANNAIGTWCRTVDFALTNGGLVVMNATPPEVRGVWVAGNGWESIYENPGGGWTRRIDIGWASAPAMDVTSIDIEYDYTLGDMSLSPGDPAIEVFLNGSAKINDPSAGHATVTGAHLTWAGLESAVTALRIFSNAAASSSSTPSGLNRIRKLTLTGTGTAPSIWTSC